MRAATRSLLGQPGCYPPVSAGVANSLLQRAGEADAEDGEVVRGRARREPLARLHELRDDVGGGHAVAARQLPVHPRLEEPAIGVAQLGDAVGEDDDEVACGELQDLRRVGLEGRVELDADRRLDHQQRALDAAGADEERRRVTGGGQLEQPGARGELAEQHGHEAVGLGVEVGLLEQPVAEFLQGFAGARRPGELAAVHGGAQHELGDEGGGHGVHALAGDVADGEGEAAGRRPRVVVEEVAAAQHAGARRAVREGDVEAGELGRRGREQAPLQALGDVGEHGERVVVGRRVAGSPSAARRVPEHHRLDRERSEGDEDDDVDAHTDDGDEEDEREGPQERARQHAREEPPPEAEHQQPAAHPAAALVFVEVARAARVQGAGQVGAVGGVHAALERQADTLAQHAVLGARVVLDEGEEAVVGRELGVGDADVQVQPVLRRVVLDLAAPAAAIEEVAQEPVEVPRDVFDVWSLGHAHASILPAPFFIGSRAP